MEPADNKWDDSSCPDYFDESEQGYTGGPVGPDMTLKALFIGIALQLGVAAIFVALFW